MFKRGSFIVCLLLGATSGFSAEWGKSKIWNDGRAEVAFYDSERVVEGKVRAFKEQILIKKEGDALKMNIVQKFEAENFPASYLITVYAKQEDVAAPVKITVGSQDWIGNHLKIYKEGSLQVISDHEGEPDQVIPLALNQGDMFEDQLPLALRKTPFLKDYEFNARIWGGMADSRSVKPGSTDAVIKVVGEEIVRSRAGSLPCWIVKVTKNGLDDTYWFEKKEPHILTKMVTAEGSKRLLTGRARWTFWDRRIPKPKILN